MAHCPYEQLKDIETVLQKIRTLPLIKEPKPGIFYLKGQSFLHFHLKGDRRWADARDTKSWGSELDIPFNAKKNLMEVFLKEVKRRHSSLV